MLKDNQECKQVQAEKKLTEILQEAEEFDADKEAWISLEKLKEVVGV